jgi:hypothetical protein
MFTDAENAAEAGVSSPADERQAALRRKNVSTTADVYVQPVPESVRAALNARSTAVFGAAKSGRGDAPSHGHALSEQHQVTCTPATWRRRGAQAQYVLITA